jgi:hypothetical protein
MGLLNKLRGTPPEEKRPAKTVLAAAMPMSGPGVQAVSLLRQKSHTEEWQNEAWYFYDAIGELRGPLIWIANAVGQAEAHATELDPDTGKPTGPSEDPVASAAAAQVLGGPAQRPGLLRLAALCWQVVGEGWVIVRPGPRGKPDTWLVLSGNKVLSKGGTWQYTDPFTGMPVVLGPQDRLIRMWSPHPSDQAKADSAVRAALPICREIEKSSQNIASRLDSRLAGNGVWLVPEEVDFPMGDHETTGAALMDLFLSIAETGIKTPGQAAAQVPVILTLPGEQIGNAVFQDFATQFDASVVELRQDALRRLAKTLDMPSDVAEGTQGDANHWSSWKVEEDTYKIFIEPLLKAIGDVVTEHWYRPALIAMGMTPERAEQFEIGWDTTSIVARPDASETLRDLHDRILISDEYMVLENGISTDAMPDDEERTRRVLEKIVMGAPTLLADPNVAAAMGLDIEISPVAAGVDAEVGAGGELEATESEPVPDNVRALPGTQGEDPEPEAVPEGLVAAAELIVYDALSRAGGRLLTNQNRGQFKSTPRHELHTVVAYEYGQIGRLLEGSFEFAEGVAESLGENPQDFTSAVRGYVAGVLSVRQPHDRDILARTLRRALRG